MKGSLLRCGILREDSGNRDGVDIGVERLASGATPPFLLWSPIIWDILPNSSQGEQWDWASTGHSSVIHLQLSFFLPCLIISLSTPSLLPYSYFFSNNLPVSNYLSSVRVGSRELFLIIMAVIIFIVMIIVIIIIIILIRIILVFISIFPTLL